MHFHLTIKRKICTHCTHPNKTNTNVLSIADKKKKQLAKLRIVET